ncbi:hypothetical protein [uncultured Salinicola sp.]|uniref:hypothetical protein n=1 Tax=uncultured Salinicola sp. TaxID=1193542 RepID=UPI00261426F7|nr:hypothetical protein [uncultured Salinicola sp.]
MPDIIRIRIRRMYESCERTTFHVMLHSDEGFEMTAAAHATGSVYTNHEGLSIEEARDRALIDAADWGDFLGIAVDPLIGDDGQPVEPSLTFDRYDRRRRLAARKRDSAQGG